jgi:peptide deformylase
MHELLPITSYGMEILKKKTKPVENIDSNIIELLENMFYTMRHANGIGLAAPQVNLDKALTIVDISCIEEYKNFKPVILINPVVEEFHGEAIFEEGCLSIPDVRAEIKRPDQILVKYNDFDLNEVKQEFDGFLSRVIQHEIDHLNGILFVDYLSKQERKEYKKQLSDIKKGKITPDYPLQINSNGFHGF